MRAFVVSILCVCFVAPSSTASAAERAPGHHTRAQAESNVMAAHRVLHQWKAGLVNPKTHLPRNNIWVRCSGRGSRTRAGYGRFRCIVGYRTVRVRVRYLSKEKNAFELHDRKVYRV